MSSFIKNCKFLAYWIFHSKCRWVLLVVSLFLLILFILRGDNLKLQRTRNVQIIEEAMKSPISALSAAGAGHRDKLIKNTEDLNRHNRDPKSFIVVKTKKSNHAQGEEPKSSVSRRDKLNSKLKGQRVDGQMPGFLKKYNVTGQDNKQANGSKHNRSQTSRADKLNLTRTVNTENSLKSSSQTRKEPKAVFPDKESVDYWAEISIPLPEKKGLVFNMTAQFPITKGRDNSSLQLPMVIAISPTYNRTTQKVDLTSLCQTLMNVPNLIWIVVEDSDSKTELVSQLLNRCGVWSIHLNVSKSGKWPHAKGVEQRNLGLSWLLKFCSESYTCSGGVFFMDDDNGYDLRLFEEIRATKYVSVWPVGFINRAPFEGPVCNKNGRVDKWLTRFNRTIPIDMAGFAVSIKALLDKPKIRFGRKPSGEVFTGGGLLETTFLKNFVDSTTDPRLECRGLNSDVLVWHTKTEDPRINK